MRPLPMITCAIALAIACAPPRAAVAADGSWPAGGRLVMPVLDQPWLMYGGPGQLLLVGRTPLCQSDPDSIRTGIARGIVSTSGELVSGGGTEQVLACPGVGFYSNDGPSWINAVGDGAGNAYSVYYVGQSFNYSSYQVYANQTPILAGSGEVPVGVVLAPMGGGLVSAAWVSEHYHRSALRTLRWRALPTGPAVVLDTLMTGSGRATTCADGRGGAFVAWYRGGLGDPSRLMRFDSGGSPAWAAPVSFSTFAVAVDPDSAGGVYVSSYYLYYDSTSVRHFDSDGSPHAGWPANGIVTRKPCGSFAVETDGMGGLFVGSSCSTGSVTITRILASGETAAGWESGVAVTGSYVPVIDGHGGLYVLQSRLVSGDRDIYVTHVLSDGTYAGAPTGELFVSAPGRDSIAAAIPDSTGGFYAAWTNSGNGYIGHHVADASTPAAFSIVRSQAVAGGVEVTWMVGDPAFRGSIERSAASAPWRTLTEARPDAGGNVTLRDADVTGGATYCYRLATGVGGIAGTEACVTARATAWVTLPPGPVPTRGRLEWTLAPDSRAAVDVTLFDIAGRAVLRSRVPMGHGAIEVPRGAAAGVYLLELRQGTHALRTRVVLVD